MTSGPPTTRLSLLARATVLPASSGRPGAPQARTADDGRNHDVHLADRPPIGDGLRADQQFYDLGRQTDQSCRAAGCRIGHDDPPGPNCLGLPQQQLRCCDGPTDPRARSVPPDAAITSSVLRPMLPVEPRTANVGHADQSRTSMMVVQLRRLFIRTGQPRFTHNVVELCSETARLLDPVARKSDTTSEVFADGR